MRELSNEDLLTAWERGLAEPQAAVRALAMLSAGYPDVSYDELVKLTIGERDGLLLELREQLFGPRMEGRMNCSTCATELEINFRVSDVIAAAAHEGHEYLAMRREEYEVEFRLPNSLDLMAISAVEGFEEKRTVLLGRVILRASRRGEYVPYSELPEPVLDDLEDAMEVADPQADIRLNLKCEACGQAWQALFDVVSFCWKELDACAIRLLREVHTLARGYGWREADVLRLRPLRRQCYLEMLAG